LGLYQALIVLPFVWDNYLLFLQRVKPGFLLAPFLLTLSFLLFISVPQMILGKTSFTALSYSLYASLLSLSLGPCLLIFLSMLLSLSFTLPHPLQMSCLYLLSMSFSRMPCLHPSCPVCIPIAMSFSLMPCLHHSFPVFIYYALPALPLL
jgi:hypothetical protein